MCAASTRWMNNPEHVVIYSGGGVWLLFAFLFVPDIMEPARRGHRCGYLLAGLPADHEQCRECSVTRVFMRQS